MGFGRVTFLFSGIRIILPTAKPVEMERCLSDACGFEASVGHTSPETCRDVARRSASSSVFQNIGDLGSKDIRH